MTLQKIALAAAVVAGDESGGHQGGEVWMINPTTGQARNCYWTGSDSYRYITCANS